MIEAVDFASAKQELERLIEHGLGDTWISVDTLSDVLPDLEWVRIPGWGTKDAMDDSDVADWGACPQLASISNSVSPA